MKTKLKSRSKSGSKNSEIMNCIKDAELIWTGKILC